MYFNILNCVTILGTLHQARALIEFDEMPPKMQKCLSDYTNQAFTLMQSEQTDQTIMTEKDIYMRCLEKVMWKTDQIRWSDFNITTEDLAWANSLLMPMFQSGRSKRQTDDSSSYGMYPPSGFRVRREYRRLSDGERDCFHRAINKLKTSGRYDTLANLHTGITVNSAHGGPNFLGWHRVYLTVLEEAIRRIDSRLSIPYWDSTMDFDMENPTDSIIWSHRFLGNGDGFVTSGPFANWTVGITKLSRNIGGRSRLLSKTVIQTVLTRCRTSEIMIPTATSRFNLEYHHGGPHNWIGGQMSGLNTSAHDPVFFLLHSFIDYIWEMFRIGQVTRCGVDPEKDYPPTTGLHAPNRKMDGFPQYRNIDGYRHYWTRYWYRYERAPSCSSKKPSCGSPYLRCDRKRWRCVSIARFITCKGASGALTTGPPSAFPTLAATNAQRARVQVDSVNIGQRFIAPPPEPRTQAFAALNTRVMRLSRRNANPSFASTFRRLSFPVSLPEPLLPSIDDPITPRALGRRNMLRRF